MNEDRRSALVDRLADHVLDKGLGATSLRVLAKAAGTSDRMLLYYFVDKDAVIVAILEELAARMTMILAASASRDPLSAVALKMRLSAVVLDDKLWPYMRLWLDIAARAAHGDPLCRSVGSRLADGFLLWIEGQLLATSRARAPALFAGIEGLVLLKALGANDIARKALRRDD